VKVELSCPSCGRTFLVDEADAAHAPCPGCGVKLGRESGTPPGSPRASAPPAEIMERAPRSASTPARPVAPAAKPAERGDVQEGVVCPRCGLHFTPRAARAPVRPAEDRTVLVVEDMEYFKNIARDALEPRYQVKSASTIDEARAALVAGGIDLMVLDLTLEGAENGMRLLQELSFKPCPILIFTAEEESVMYGETWARLQELGADDVVIKGMNVGESILRKVGSLLGDPVEDEAAP
jgi:CheY-like chemotaxis protein/DNA-directed RNA polymerase subunit RPC12/RpoP